MDEEERTSNEQELNNENDAREEDIVSDVDSDTRDVEENDNNDEVEIMRRLSRLEEMVSRALGSIDALRDAQSIMIDNGATIMDDTDEKFDFGVDDFVSPSELDFTI